jgi:hypothetical protein
MAKAYKYSGILSKPMPLLIHIGYFADPANKKYETEYGDALSARESRYVDALFTDCGLSRSDPFGWQHLALTLARRHVTAFQPPPSSHRSRGRPAKHDWNLVDEVLEVATSRSLSIKSASRIIAKRRGNKIKAETIESRYHNCMKAGKKASVKLEAVLMQLRQK